MKRAAVLLLLALAPTSLGGCSLLGDQPPLATQAAPEPMVAAESPTGPFPTHGTTMSVEKTGSMTMTVVYDNNPYDPRLRTDWGFSCLIELNETTLLFDTGGDGEMLLSNMSTMALDPQEIDHVVLSHIHGDHTGGVRSLLATGVRPVVHVPHSFPEAFRTNCVRGPRCGT